MSIAPTLRFHLDEHVDPAIADALRNRGIDVTTTVGVGLRTKTDEEQLAYCLIERRILMTHDADFLIAATSGTRHAGICYCHQQTRTVGELVKALTLLANCVDTTEMENRIEFV